MSLETFREKTRAWLEENCPTSMREPAAEDQIIGGGKRQEYEPDQKLWLDRMAARGWTAPRWPTEYGGGGSPSRNSLYSRKKWGALTPVHPLLEWGFQ